jgi:hypothetical protein
MGRTDDTPRKGKMKYVLLVYESIAWDISNWSAEERASLGESAAIEQLPGVTAGRLLGDPDLATTVHVKNGETRVADGPFVDAEGAVSSYYLLDADDLDVAIELAARFPAARRGGAVEIRPAES